MVKTLMTIVVLLILKNYQILSKVIYQKIE